VLPLSMHVALASASATSKSGRFTTIACIGTI
jgi:hypothetical protein